MHSDQQMSPPLAPPQNPPHSAQQQVAAPPEMDLERIKLVAAVAARSTTQAPRGSEEAAWRPSPSHFIKYTNTRDSRDRFRVYQLRGIP